MSNADVELLTEHFGYPPVSLLDDIINSVNIYSERALNSVEQALLRLPPASLGFNPASFQNKDKGAGASKLSQDALEAAAEEARHHEIENGTHQLETLLCASIDRNFDKFEIYAMRNILCVKPEDRDWLRLAHYEGLVFDTDEEADKEEGDADSDASIAHLHRRLQASLKLGHLLDVESQQNEAMLRSLRSIAGAAKTDPSSSSSSSSSSSLAFLLNRGPLTESDAAAPLTTTTAFALSQLPALRQLSGELRQKAPGLSAAAAADNDEAGGSDSGNGAAAEGGRADSRSKTWRRERVEYVESSTRKHLERVRGLSLGRNGETHADIESESGSGAISVEPEALKNILSILRDTHGSKPAAVAADTSQHDGEAMDEAMDES